MDSQPSSDGLEDGLRHMSIGHGKDGDHNSALGLPGDRVPKSNEAAKPSKKRLNQAQRRQMFSQLSIPIDTRSRAPQLPRSRLGPENPDGPEPVARLAPLRSDNRYITRAHPIAASGLPYRGQMNQRQVLTASRLVVPSSDERVRCIPGNDRSPALSLGKLHYLHPEELRVQIEWLEKLCETAMAGVELGPAEMREKEVFWSKLEQVVRAAVSKYEVEQNGLHDFPPQSVQLKCFGSLSSGFPTKASDMDLGLISPFSRVQPDAAGSPIPRLVEKALLDYGVGARLLTRTRVPIIKVCEKPTEKLRVDLLQERARWEGGGLGNGHGVENTEPMDGVDGVDEAEDAEDANFTEPADDQKLKPVHPTIETARAERCTGNKKSRSGSPPDDRPPVRFGLRQGKQQTLENYYTKARKLLQQAGGRDLIGTNAGNLSGDNMSILNDFSRAFVHGLVDRELRLRLCSYRSLDGSDLAHGSQPGNHRSLQGVYAQVEGERLVMSWECRIVREKDAYQEQQGQRCVDFWREQQDKRSYGLDPVGYAEELQRTLEQLKKMASIQLMTLAQCQHEPVPSYLSRTNKIMLELGAHDPSWKAEASPREESVLPVLIRRYVEGIRIDEIKCQVRAFVGEMHTPSLRDVGRKHLSVQLAHDYENALERGCYQHDEIRASVKTYIGMLRGGQMSESPSMPNSFEFRVRLPRPFAARMKTIHELGDPARLEINKARDAYRDQLEFPESGTGVQCDINFSAHLALHNTILLRCYSFCDRRVRPLVLFVKHWAKLRCINTPYRGTLSSYGYVLMVLHYLVNVVSPCVCPNLQLLRAPAPPAPPAPPYPPCLPHLTPPEVQDPVTCRGYNVRFWRDETEIQCLARENAITRNRDSIGYLLRGFFEYYAQNGPLSTLPTCRGFDWGRHVLSLRTPGGLLTKQGKGWTGAKTVMEKMPESPPGPTQAAGPAGPAGLLPAGPKATVEIKEVRHRYLFAIEDPFEIDHNVARTVSHNGIVAIRDEFRRAWRIIKSVGKPGQMVDDLLQDVYRVEEIRTRNAFGELLADLHGQGFDDICNQV